MATALMALAALALAANQPSSLDSASDPVSKSGSVAHPRVVLDRGAHPRVFDAPGGDELGRIRPRTQFGSRTVLAVADRRGPWVAVETALAGNAGHGWIRLDAGRMHTSATRWSLHADLSETTLEVLRGERVVDRIPASVGGPATPTPTGSFGVTDRIGDGISPPTARARSR